MSQQAGREARQSEKTFKNIASSMFSLGNCVWYPLPESALEYISLIQKWLLELEKEIKEEQKNAKS